MTNTIATPQGAQRSATRQDALHATLVAALDTLDHGLETLVRDMDPHSRAAAPPDGGWSIDAILEHLCLINTDYLRAMEQAIDRSNTPRRSSAWRQTWGGWLLARSMQSSWRLKAPRSTLPGPVPREMVLDAFLATTQTLRALLHRANGLEWREVRLVSPYAHWLRLNFGDAALITVRHAERHGRQMARVARAMIG